MLDFLLVLGQIPGTHIQLNFFEIISLSLTFGWLAWRQHYALVYKQLQTSKQTILKTNRLRSLIIWLALAIDRPRTVRH